jgi:hypothetical protein
LAPCHYATKVTDYMKEIRLDIIPKKSNAPNVPQARGIEQFWAACKRKYKKRLNEPKNIRGFKKVWSTISKSVSEQSGKLIMRNSYKNLMKIAFKGVQGGL